MALWSLYPDLRGADASWLLLVPLRSLWGCFWRYWYNWNQALLGQSVSAGQSWQNCQERGRKNSLFPSAIQPCCHILYWQNLPESQLEIKNIPVWCNLQSYSPAQHRSIYLDLRENSLATLLHNFGLNTLLHIFELIYKNKWKHPHSLSSKRRLKP